MANFIDYIKHTNFFILIYRLNYILILIGFHCFSQKLIVNGIVLDNEISLKRIVQPMEQLPILTENFLYPLI
jgi:hypothetical protein